MFGRNRRWSGNERHFGPFTISVCDNYESYGVSVLSYDDSDDYDGSHIHVNFGRYAFFMELPDILRPWREEHISSQPGGGVWHESHRRRYGISVITEGFLQVFYGAQTWSSDTTKSWAYFLPFTQWRFHRISFHGIDGNEVWTQTPLTNCASGSDQFDAQYAAKNACPTAQFRFLDYDGEEIEVRTIIEEREWRFGEGCFEWLSYFRKPTVIRSLDLEFSKETGHKKGSWKGGITGCNFVLLPGELHADAFRRYCLQHDMTYIGAVEP